MDKTTSKTIKISHDTLVNTITSLLYALSVIDDDIEILDIDLGLEVDEKGMVEIDITTAFDKPEGHPYEPPKFTQLDLGF